MDTSTQPINSLTDYTKLETSTSSDALSRPLSPAEGVSKKKTSIMPSWKPQFDNFERELEEQNREEHAKWVAEGERLYQEYEDIDANARAKAASDRRRRDLALSSVLISAQRNNGFIPKSQLDALSRDLGVQVSGGNIKDGNLYLFGPSEKMDATGKKVTDPFAPIAIATPEAQFQVLSRSGLSAARGLMQGIYDKMRTTYTPTQLEKAGIVNPQTELGFRMATGGGAGGREIGSVTLPKAPDRRPSRIEAFSADGAGGFSKSVYDRRTGENWNVDYGTRSPNTPDSWSWISSGSDNGVAYKDWRNRKTGEVVRVRDGETPPWRGGGATAQSDRYAIEQMRQNNLNQRQERQLDYQRERQAREESRWEREHRNKISQWQTEQKLALEKAKSDDERSRLRARLQSADLWLGLAKHYGETLKDPDLGAEDAKNMRAQYNEIIKRLADSGLELGDSKETPDPATGGDDLSGKNKKVPALSISEDGTSITDGTNMWIRTGSTTNAYTNSSGITFSREELEEELKRRQGNKSDK